MNLALDTAAGAARCCRWRCCRSIFAVQKAQGYPSLAAVVPDPLSRTVDIGAARAGRAEHRRADRGHRRPAPQGANHRARGRRRAHRAADGSLEQHGRHVRRPASRRRRSLQVRRRAPPVARFHRAASARPLRRRRLLDLADARAADHQPHGCRARRRRCHHAARLGLHQRRARPDAGAGDARGRSDRRFARHPARLRRRRRDRPTRAGEAARADRQAPGQSLLALPAHRRRTGHLRSARRGRPRYAAGAARAPPQSLLPYA